MRIFCLFFVLLCVAPPVQAASVSETFQGRDMIIYVPDKLPSEGQRAMVVALHGGLGNAHFMPEHLGMDEVAEKNGFIVAYLNGTQGGRMLPEKMKTWNAGGGCCGLSFKNDVDDVSYITEAVKYLTQKYGVDPQRIYGTGHSNGAMMTQRLICETNVYQAAVPISGTLLSDESCPAAKDKHILAIHGELDENVPIAGGVGDKGLSRLPFRSEADTQKIYQQSGATYKLQLVPNADHSLVHINEALQKSEGLSVAEKEAQFFGLAH